MKIEAITKNILNLKLHAVKKVPKHIAAIALGTGLLFAGGVAKAQNSKDELVLNKSEMTKVENAEASNNESLKGGLIFGVALLAYMGICALGNRIHDKKQ